MRFTKKVEQKRMSEIDRVTGQLINYKEGNDNAPPSYSAPSSNFKTVLQFYASPHCPKCGGTGYISIYKSVVGGRCFKCIPDPFWNGLLGDLVATGTDDANDQAVCEIREVTSDIYNSSGYIVTQVGLPPIDRSPIFPELEDAVQFAREIYGI